jgi:CO/xanthine dehydrogenase Mo-binding subunit
MQNLKKSANNAQSAMPKVALSNMVSAWRLSYRGCSMGAEGVDTGTALVQVNHDGSISVSTSVAENGQGLQTTMSLIAAESFGVTLKNVVFSEPPTSVIADGGPTVASRATLMGGQCRGGCRREDQGAYRGCHRRTASRSRAWLKPNGETAQFSTKRILSTAFRSFSRQHHQMGICQFGGLRLVCRTRHPLGRRKRQRKPYFTWVYGCNIAEVAVDTSTGKVTMQRVTAVHDVGKVINPVGFEGQVCGGIAQGCGYAVLEDFNIEHGIVKSENFDSYLLPTIKDIPPIDVYAVENHDPHGPFGAKSIGEPATELAAAAINNAVNFALGTAFNKLPLTLEQVFLGYNLKKPVRQSEKILCKHPSLL